MLINRRRRPEDRGSKAQFGLVQVALTRSGNPPLRGLIIQYNFIAKCQYNCTRNVLWCQVHSSHIHSSHKTSLNYNSKHPGKGSFINKYMRNPTDIKLCISHKNCLFFGLIPTHSSHSKSYHTAKVKTLLIVPCIKHLQNFCTHIKRLELPQAI